MNAHAAWMVVVGSTLAQAARRGDTPDQLATLGGCAAGALALNDALLWREVTHVYRRDLFYEALLLGAWVATRSPLPSGARPRPRTDGSLIAAPEGHLGQGAGLRALSPSPGSAACGQQLPDRNPGIERPRAERPR